MILLAILNSQIADCVLQLTIETPIAVLKYHAKDLKQLFKDPIDDEEYTAVKVFDFCFQEVLKSSKLLGEREGLLSCFGVSRIITIFIYNRQ